MPKHISERERTHRLEHIIRHLREREAHLRRRLERAHRQLQEVGNQMMEAFVQIDAHTDAVVAGAELRALAWQELDIEESIGLAIDHIAARMGACNVALWLSSSRGEFGVAGYGFHDVPRALAEASLGLMGREVCPLLGPECVAQSFEDGGELLSEPPPGGGVLRGRRVLLCPLAHRGEILGAVMLFRSEHSPWPEHALETMGALCEAFGEQLDRIIRVTHRNAGHWPGMEAD